MIFNKYTTKEHDRIDLIVLNHYGHLEHLNTVLSVNTHLFSKSLNVGVGVVVNLPVIKKEKVKEQPKVRKPLW